MKIKNDLIEKFYLSNSELEKLGRVLRAPITPKILLYVTKFPFTWQNCIERNSWFTWRNSSVEWRNFWFTEFRNDMANFLIKVPISKLSDEIPDLRDKVPDLHDKFPNLRDKIPD